MGSLTLNAKQYIRWASEYRWPLYLAGILGMSIVAQGVMVWHATRPEAPRAQADFYDRSLRWDADQALLAASRELGWRVAFDVPAGAEYVAGMAQPVDVRVTDRDGAPVRGLAGTLVAIRPADTRLSNEGPLTELPHEPGRYRALVRLPADGLWELGLDTTRAGLRFVHQARLDIRHDAQPPAHAGKTGGAG